MELQNKSSNKHSITFVYLISFIYHLFILLFMVYPGTLSCLKSEPEPKKYGSATLVLVLLFTQKIIKKRQLPSICWGTSYYWWQFAEGFRIQDLIVGLLGIQILRFSYRVKN
jgi:hypothetical protein